MAQDPPSFNVKSSIMAALEETEDKAMRTILLLLLGVFEHVGGELSGVNSKLDAILADERALKDKVLNGHADTHDDDHDWLHEYRGTVARRESVCAWAEAQMAAQEAAAQERKTDWRAFRSRLFEGAAVMLIGALSAAAGIGWMVK